MQIISISDPHALKLACDALSAGQLVIYPTETCYGLAVDCHIPQAVSHLLEYKGDRHRQISIAVDSLSMAKKYVSLNAIAHNLYEHFLPGPITVISQSLHNLDSRLESVDGTLGVRFPAHPFAQALIEAYGKPITATSANTSGKKEPYSLADWHKYTTVGKQAMVSLFLDAGHLIDRPTSTVVDTTLNDPQVLRQGTLIIPDLSPTITTHSSTETQDVAAKITKQYLALTRRFPLILALQGDLGVGKTQFVKGVASALGISLNVNSPTYTLMKEYPYTTTKYSGILYHLDTWRLADPTELESTLHLSKLLVPSSIVTIEWAGKAQTLLKEYQRNIPILVINIKEIDVSTRQITYAFSTPEWD